MDGDQIVRKGTYIGSPIRVSLHYVKIALSFSLLLVLLPPAMAGIFEVPLNSAYKSQKEIGNVILAQRDLSDKAARLHISANSSASAKAENAYEAQCAQDKNAWKTCVQVKLRRFAYSERKNNATSSGIVVVQFNYDEEGYITRVIVKKSSGDENLDKRAVKLLERVDTIPAPLDGSGALTVPIQFKADKKVNMRQDYYIVFLLLNWFMKD